ncbi:hypothetical protein AVEN_240127-1 [Araneus ventricosus]|uniref:Mos1 transposase HTH domain-containing protein n=1 Tax=Araneus ventricosus TaxID=182803 RepID=A0A4Y2X1X0_ARAVE|nr:hypothetical protein AVEN_124876-1 [Araneus ventricosus]GBO43531.1 hypothetical protein AVEN_240127-1 [Araneus ventricosus]
MVSSYILFCSLHNIRGRVNKFPEWSPTFTQLFVGGEIFFWRLAALRKKTQSHLEFISGTVGISCRSFLTKRIFHSSDFEMSSSEQRANIKFCGLLEKPPSEMLKKTYGNYAMKKTAVYEWHTRFRLKVAQTSKMTLGLGAAPLPPQIKMLRTFEKSWVRTDE